MSGKEEKKYSDEDLNTIVAQRINKERTDELAKRFSDSEVENRKIFSKIEISLKALTESISKSSSDLYKCRDELRSEIKKDFVSKERFDVEMDKIEGMIKGQWRTITVAVTVAMVVINIAFKFFGG